MGGVKILFWILAGVLPWSLGSDVHSLLSGEDLESIPGEAGKLLQQCWNIIKDDPEFGYTRPWREQQLRTGGLLIAPLGALVEHVGMNPGLVSTVGGSMPRSWDDANLGPVGRPLLRLLNFEFSSVEKYPELEDFYPDGQPLPELDVDDVGALGVAYLERVS